MKAAISSALRHLNIAPPSFHIRCEDECDTNRATYLDRLPQRKIPPMPVTRFMLREHLFDSGLAMNFCGVEKWNPIVFRIT
jgi:hypothetical protein